MGIIGKCKEILRLSNKRKEWRARNPHNDTWLEQEFNFSSVEVGKRSYGPLNIYSWSAHNEKLVIGDYVSISHGVKFILGGNHRYDTLSTFPFRVRFLGEQREEYSNGPIIVKDGVWIGLDSMIMSGVTIGKGAVIAARSVVTKDVPDYSVVGGNPAKIIKYRFDNDLIKEVESINLSQISEDKIKANLDLLNEPLSHEVLQKIKDKIYT